jgi:hypothetical protein
MADDTNAPIRGEETDPAELVEVSCRLKAQHPRLLWLSIKDFERLVSLDVFNHAVMMPSTNSSVTRMPA